MSALESRYRRILLLLPAAYRESRGEEMLSTLLDAAKPAQRWPRVGEAASLAAFAVRLRVGAPGGTRRAEAYGEVLRRIALAGLFAEALWYGAWGGSSVILAASSRYGYIANSANSDWLAAQAVSLGLPCVLVAAYLVLVLGRRRLGRALGVLQGVLVPVEIGMVGQMGRSDRAAVTGVAALVALATLLGFHREAPPVRRPGRWLGVMAAGLGLAVATSAFTQYSIIHVHDWYLGVSDASRLLFGPLGPALAVGFAALRARRSPVWPAALLALSLPGLFLVPRTVLLFSLGKQRNVFVGDMFSGGMWPGEAAEVVIVVVALALTLWWALHRQRARPAAEPDAAIDVP